MGMRVAGRLYGSNLTRTAPDLCVDEVYNQSSMH